MRSIFRWIRCKVQARCYTCNLKLIDWGAYAPSGNVFCPVHDLHLDESNIPFYQEIARR